MGRIEVLLQSRFYLYSPMKVLRLSFRQKNLWPKSFYREHRGNEVTVLGHIPNDIGEWIGSVCSLSKRGFCPVSVCLMRIIRSSRWRV